MELFLAVGFDLQNMFPPVMDLYQEYSEILLLENLFDRTLHLDYLLIVLYHRDLNFYH